MMCLQGSKPHLVDAVNIGDVPRMFIFLGPGLYIKLGEGRGGRCLWMHLVLCALCDITSSLGPR